MAVMYTIMSYGGLVMALVCLGIALVMFFRFDIPKVFGDMTGRTQKRAIEKIRKEGYESGISKQKAVKVHADSAEIKAHAMETDIRENMVTSKKLPSPEGVTNTVFHVYDPEEDTSVLSALPEEVTTVLQMAAEPETSVLASEEEEKTTVLSADITEGIIRIPDEILTPPGTIHRVLDLIVTHTSERIGTERE